jgi:hypothetical protein
MPDPLIYLSWERDAAGYELLPAVEAKPGEGLIGSSARPSRIIPRGGQLIRYAPLEAERLYSRFASVKTPDELLSFVDKFGPLTEGGRDKALGDDVSFILDHAKTFRDWLGNQQDNQSLARWVSADGLHIARLEIKLVQDPASGGVRLQYRPPSLLSALWLQLMQRVTGARPYRECLDCGLWFEVGPGSGRRQDAKFCSPEHQILFNRRKQTKGSKTDA